MNEKDLLAVALKHKLPMVSTTQDGAWAYTEQVLAFGRELVGEECPDNHAFSPLPLPVHSHAKLGHLYARFDLQLYAVQFEKRSRKAISATLGLEGADAGDPNAIIVAIEALKASNAHITSAARDVLANGQQHDVGGGDVFIGTCDSTEALQCALDGEAAFDECAASGQSCSYAPSGSRCGMQCRYCGKPKSEAKPDAAPTTSPDDCKADAWWVKALNVFWGSGYHDKETRRAAKVACDMAAQFAEKAGLNGDLLALLADVLEAKDVMREAGCEQETFGEMFSEFIGKHQAAPTNPESFEQFVKDEYGMTTQQAARASFGISGLRQAFGMGQRSKEGK